MPTVFISYRRNDTSKIANQIWERLKAVWGEEKIIKDTDSFLIGVDFRKEMSRYIQRSDVVLVLIGQNWLGINEATGISRIFEPNDPVRIEIEEAIRLKKVIIPVLVNDRQMPESADLPETINGLRYYNAFHINDGTFFNRDMDKLNSYFINPDLLANMGKDALPSDLYYFKPRIGVLGWIIGGIRTLACFIVLGIYWLVIGYTTPWIFPPEILRISGSNYLIMILWGDDARLEWLKVFVVLISLIIDWQIVGKLVAQNFHRSLFPVSDFVATLIFGTLQILVAVVLLAIGLSLERRKYPYRNVINLRKTLLVVTVNGLLSFASSFQFWGTSYLYFPIFASVLSVSRFIYALIGIGLASYKDNLSGINRVLEKRSLRQERATLISKEYSERRKLLHKKNLA